MVTYATLCYIIKHGKVLLQKKSAGRFGEGKWNGPGGKLIEGEKLHEGAVREVFEETGLEISDVKCHGLLKFYFGAEPKMFVHIFSTEKFKGRPENKGEGILKWFDAESIPYDNMWADDEHWMPLLLEGKEFEGVFYFDREGKKLVDFDIKTGQKIKKP